MTGSELPQPQGRPGLAQRQGTPKGRRPRTRLHRASQTPFRGTRATRMGQATRSIQLESRTTHSRDGGPGRPHEVKQDFPGTESRPRPGLGRERYPHLDLQRGAQCRLSLGLGPGAQSLRVPLVLSRPPVQARPSGSRQCPRNRAPGHRGTPGQSSVGAGGHVLPRSLVQLLPPPLARERLQNTRISVQRMAML